MAGTIFKEAERRAVLDKLRGLPPKVQRKYLNGSIRAGAKIVQQAAQRNARALDDPKTPKAIWKEIVIKTNSKLGRQNHGAALQVGVKGGARKYADNKFNRRKRRVGKTYETSGNVYYWRFLEFGTSRMPAHPFMLPALRDNADAATTAIAQKLSQSLDVAVKE